MECRAPGKRVAILAEKMKEQAAEYAEIKELEEVKKIELTDNKREMMITTEKGSYLTNSVVLCMGTKNRKLDVKGEKEFLVTLSS